MPDDILPHDIIEATNPDLADVPQVLERLKAIQDILDKELRDRLGEEIADPADHVDLDAAFASMAKRTDGLACFNYLYRVITAEINVKIEDENFFHDNDFLTKFDVAFAQRYLGAIRKYTDQHEYGTAPACWRVLFENRENPKISPMQFAIAGVTCHVWLDLPIALVNVCKETKKTLDVGVHDDFQEVNIIFYEKIPKLRRHFENTSERELDHSIIKRLTNHMCDFTVMWARDRAWRHGMKLWDEWGPGDEPKDEEKVAETEKELDNHAAFMVRATLGLL